MNEIYMRYGSSQCFFPIRNCGCNVNIYFTGVYKNIDYTDKCSNDY